MAKKTSTAAASAPASKGEVQAQPNGATGDLQVGAAPLTTSQDPSMLEPGPYDYENHPSFLAPPTAPASSAHGLGLGPTLVVLDDPSKKYLTAQQSFYASNPYSAASPASSQETAAAAPVAATTPTPAPIPTPSAVDADAIRTSIPDVAPPLPVSLPRLPCIPPLVVHQEQLYFDDGLGAPGKCPHDRSWGVIGSEHREERGLGLSDVEMDDFMVDLGDLISKEYDAWIERCWVEAFHYTYTVSLPALVIGFVLAGASPTFLRRNIIYGGPHMDALLAQHFRTLLRDEHERRMSDECGSRRGVDIGNLLAGLVPGTVAGGGAGGSAAAAPPSDSIPGQTAAEADPSSRNRLGVGGGLDDPEARGEGAPAAVAAQQPMAPYTPPMTPNGDQPAGEATLNASNPASSSSSAAAAAAAAASQQRHLWDPARTGYGNGICFHDLALLHGRAGDDHGPCMCDLTACRTCFHELLYFRGRRDVAPLGMGEHAGGGGGFGQEGQAHHAQQYDASGNLMANQAGPGPMKRPSPLQIRHPEMADILLVEEHLRTRLHYMASPDVILRYGDEDEFIPTWESASAADFASDNPAPRAKEIIGKNGQVKVINGKKGKGGKLKIPARPPPPAATAAAASAGERRLNGSQLPRSWTDETASARNMAVILTFRHLVKLLHATTLYLSPFDFDDYADDSAVLTEIHPLAVYRRLVEPYVQRRAMMARTGMTGTGQHANEPVNDATTAGGDVSKVDVAAWKHCMEQWEKEVAVREKEGVSAIYQMIFSSLKLIRCLLAQGNAILKTQPARAVAFYTQAICLDSENPVYYLNRAAAFNAIENYEDAEIDCSRALSLNKTHMKAWYRRAVARKGMGRLDEAEQDLLHLLNQAPNIAAATAELASIRKEIEEMKRREEVDDLD